MLAGPFALLLTLVVALVAVAGLVALVGALLAAPYVLVARLRRRREHHAFRPVVMSQPARLSGLR